MIDELPIEPLPRFAFTAEEAAAVLGWAPASVYEAIRGGYLAKIPHTGRKVLIARAELERFAAEGVKQVAS